MNKFKISFTFLLVLCVTTISAQKNFGNITFNKAVNVSGKQRMLSQKIAKTYLFLSNYPDDLKAKRVLINSKIIFEKQNEILHKNATTDHTKKLLKNVDNIWANFKSILDQAPTKENIYKIVKTNTLLLNASNSVVESIVNDSKDKAYTTEPQVSDKRLKLKNIINLSGKQRMLSQRMALYYFANQNADGKFEAKWNKDILKSVYNELDDAVTLLLVSNFNNDKIDDALVTAMLKWDDLRANKDKLFKNKYDSAKLYEISDELTSAFNEITILYENIDLGETTLTKR